MRGRRRAPVLAPILVLVAATVSTSCTSTTGDQSRANDAPITSSRTLGETVGPNGEKATPTTELQLTSADIAKVRAGHHTAALVWHENSDFTTVVNEGVRAQFNELGIEVVAETSAGFDAAKQKLTDLGFTNISKKDQASADPANNVIDQNPAAFSQQSKDTQITLTVSTGQQPPPE